MSTGHVREALVRAALVLSLASGLVTGCGSDRRGARIVLTGSSTVAPLAMEIGRRFEARRPGLRVDVQTGGSSRGIRDAREGLADLGMVSRALKGGEGDLESYTIARDGICMVVHAANPVRELSRQQVVGIYRGTIEHWGAVGGASGPITVVHKAEGRSTLELFLRFFELRNSAVRPDVVIGDNQQGIKTVAGNPGAIGYVSVGAAEYAAGHGTPLRALPMNGVEASTTAIREGRFPLSRPLNLVRRGPLEGPAKDFVDFARSEEVHDLVAKLYFVPVARGR